MNRLPVASSTVAAIGYDATTKALEVEFRNGSLYRYADVPAKVYEAVVAAPSVGRALHALVVKGGYSYVKVADDHPITATPTPAAEPRP